MVRDDEGNRASVARSVVEVPAAPRPVVGDLIVVAHSERAPKDDAAARNPLAWKGLLLYPGFGEPFSRSKQRDVSFALPMVVEPRAASPHGAVAAEAGNHLVADLPFALGQPAKSGRLVALGHLPIGDLPPGSYELQVTVADGNRREIRSAGIFCHQMVGPFRRTYASSSASRHRARGRGRQRRAFRRSATCRLEDQPGPHFGASTSGVLVDVVVRDKKGPVMDLTADDFTLTEDGKPQQIVSFDKRTVQGQVTSGDAAVAAGLAKPAGTPAVPGRRWSPWPSIA